MTHEKNDAESMPMERPWIVLSTTYDVETWIDHQNRALQKLMRKDEKADKKADRNTDRNTEACLRLRLREGGELFLHTPEEGGVLLDVTADAAWVAPAIAAAAGIALPSTVVQVWTLPLDSLTRLILGLSNLVATSAIAEHDFGRRKWR